MKDNQQSLRMWLARPLIIGVGLGYVRLLPAFEPLGVVILLACMITIPPAINPLNRGAWVCAVLTAAAYGLLSVTLKLTL